MNSGCVLVKAIHNNTSACVDSLLENSNRSRKNRYLRKECCCFLTAIGKHVHKEVLFCTLESDKLSPRVLFWFPWFLFLHKNEHFKLKFGLGPKCFKHEPLSFLEGDVVAQWFVH